MPTKNISIKASCDDGCASDVRVAKLMRKYKVPCTFYWPVEWHSLAYDKGYEPLSYVDARIIASEFEIGAHTITHRHLTKLSQRDAHREIFDSGILLKLLFDKPVTKFCPPRGYTNKELTAYTMKFYKSQRLTKGFGLVHVHPNSGANNNMHWLDYAKAYPVKEIWFHSWELDKYNEWDNLEIYLENLSR